MQNAADRVDWANVDSCRPNLSIVSVCVEQLFWLLFYCSYQNKSAECILSEVKISFHLLLTNLCNGSITDQQWSEIVFVQIIFPRSVIWMECWETSIGGVVVFVVSFWLPYWFGLFLFFSVGFWLLPFVWAINSFWFFDEAFRKPAYDEQKAIKKCNSWIYEHPIWPRMMLCFSIYILSSSCRRNYVSSGCFVVGHRLGHMDHNFPFKSRRLGRVCR